MALHNKGNIIINGSEYRTSSMKFGWNSISSSDAGRTLDGVMHPGFVLRRVLKIEIGLMPISSSELAGLLFQVQGREYQMTFYNPITDAEETKTFYTGESSSELYSGVIHNGLYIDTAFNAIQIDGETT